MSFISTPLSKCSLTHLQRSTPPSVRPLSYPVAYPSAGSAPSPLFAQTFHGAGRLPSPPSPLLAQNFSTRGHTPARAHPSRHHHDPPVGASHISLTLAYPSHSHSHPRYMQAKPILRNRGGSPPAPVVSYSPRMCTHRIMLTPSSTPAQSTSRMSGIFLRPEECLNSTEFGSTSN